MSRSDPERASDSQELYLRIVNESTMPLTSADMPVVNGIRVGVERPPSIVRQGGIPVTAAISRRPRRGKESELIAWGNGIVAAAQAFPGHVAVRVARPGDDRPDLTIAFTFACAADLQAWEASAVRGEWLLRAEDLVERRREPDAEVEAMFVPAVTGPAPLPARWKSALVVAAAFFPIMLIFDALVLPHLAGLHPVGRAAAATLLVVPLLVWGAVPVLTRALRSWLYPRSERWTRSGAAGPGRGR